MPTTLTREQLRDGARQLCDCVNDGHITDAEANGWINDAIRELWRDKSVVEPDIFLVRTTISTTAGTQSYTLPSDFQAIRRIDRVDGGNRYMLTEADPLLELDFSNLTSTGWSVQYRVMGGGIAQASTLLYLLPDPGTTSYDVWYVQSPQALGSDDAVLDVTHGEDRYVMHAVAARMARKQQDDATPFVQEQMLARDSIMQIVRRRDSGRPKRITDIRSQRLHNRRRYPAP